MLRLEFDRHEIEEVIDKVVKRTMRMDLIWDWPCGVAYYGIADVYERTGKEEYLKLLKDRVDELIKLGLPKMWTVNTCAMGHCLITLYNVSGGTAVMKDKEGYRAISRDWIQGWGQGLALAFLGRLLEVDDK